MNELSNLINLDMLETTISSMKDWTEGKDAIVQSYLEKKITTETTQLSSSISSLNSRTTSAENRIYTLENRQECQCEPVSDSEFQSMLDKVLTYYELGTDLIDSELLICTLNGSFAKGQEVNNVVISVNITLPNSFDVTAFDNAFITLLYSDSQYNGEYEVKDEDLIDDSLNQSIKKHTIDLTTGNRDSLQISNSVSCVHTNSVFTGNVARVYFKGTAKSKTYLVYGPVIRKTYKELFKTDYPALVEGNGISIKSSNIEKSKLIVEFDYTLFKNYESAEFGFIYSMDSSTKDSDLTIDNESVTKTKESITIADFAPLLTVKQKSKEFNNEGNGMCVRVYLKGTLNGKEEIVYTDVIRKTKTDFS